VRELRPAEIHRAARVPLLSGEAPDSRDRDEVEHWVAVYEQLACFLTEFAAPDEMQERYRQRLRFWRHRCAGLARPASENGHPTEAAE
jgi:hypothetical protein